MPRYEFDAPRLFVDAPLQQGGEIALAREQANYLVNVLRLKPNDRILVFNGRDGEWSARLARPSPKNPCCGSRPRPARRSPPAICTISLRL